MIGPLFALSWVAVSHGLEELVGFGSSEKAKRRGRVVAIVGFILLAGLTAGLYFRFG